MTEAIRSRGENEELLNCAFKRIRRLESAVVQMNQLVAYIPDEMPNPEPYERSRPTIDMTGRKKKLSEVLQAIEKDLHA